MLSRRGFLQRMAFAAIALGFVETFRPSALRWVEDPTAPLDGVHEVFYSMDGVNWTLVERMGLPYENDLELGDRVRGVPAVGRQTDIVAVAAGNGGFVAVGELRENSVPQMVGHSVANAGPLDAPPPALPDSFAPGDVLMLNVVSQGGVKLQAIGAYRNVKVPV